jgi:RNA polymerase-binding transcription factor DksA
MTMDSNFDLRLRLTARLAQLERHLREIESDRRRMTNPLDRDWEEQGPTRQHDAVLDRLAAGDHRQIAAIRAALTRMAQGTYGICRTCEEPITPQRLTALPYATQCLACATQAERQGSKFRAYGTNGSS